MKQIKLSPLKKPVTAEISLPGCIGYTIRALNIGAMTKGDVVIMNPLKSEDTIIMVEALRTLGIAVVERENAFIVRGDIDDVKEQQYTIDIGLSGRTARSILALLCIVPGEKTVICAEPFKKRPIGELVEGLRQIGAIIEYVGEKNYLPVKISSSVLKAGTVKMEGTLSSQFFSAIMMVAPLVGEITIEVIGKQSSKPFIDMTIAIMRDFGVFVINENYRRYSIGKSHYKNAHVYLIEPEATSASYFFAIAALTESKIKILKLNPNSVQGDIFIVDLLQRMGCRVEKNVEEKWIEVTGTSKLTGITIDLNGTPDLVPTMAVIGAFAKGETTLTNIAHVRLKETDRIESPAMELQKMGIKTEVTENSLTVFGGRPKPATIDTYHDHRMAMAFAVAGSKIPGITINDSAVVNKSFPEFWMKLEKIGIGIKEVL